MSLTLENFLVGSYTDAGVGSGAIPFVNVPFEKLVNRLGPIFY